MKRMLHAVHRRGGGKTPHTNSGDKRDDDNSKGGEESTWPESYPSGSFDRNTATTPASRSTTRKQSATKKDTANVEWEDSLTGTTTAVSSYRGEVDASNRPHGWGLAQLHNGDVVEGQWVNGVFCHGTYTYRNGNQYTGDFEDNTFHGSGTYIWPSGERYAGDYRHGKMHGHGQFSWPDGRVYVGCYRDGCRNGQGIMMDRNGDVVHEGEWKDGAPVPRDLTKHKNEEWRRHVYVYQRVDDSEVVSSIEETTGCLHGRIKAGADGRIVELDLSWCLELTRLPPEIGKLSKLVNLNLSGCMNLLHLPPTIRNLSELKEINLSGCEQLRKLPSSIGQLSNLTELVLSNCKNLEQLPAEVGQLSNLRILSLGGCDKLNELPAEVGRLSQLGVLGLGGCTSLRALPPEIRRLAENNTISVPMHLMFYGKASR